MTVERRALELIDLKDSIEDFNWLFVKDVAQISMRLLEDLSQKMEASTGAKVVEHPR